MVLTLLRLCFFSLIILVPLYFGPSFTTYTLPKVVINQVFVLLMLGLWFLQMALSKKIEIKRSYLLLPILFYLFFSILSLTWSISVSGGASLLWQVFSYILLYFIIINNFSEKELSLWVLVLTVVGLMVSSYGVLQYFGVEPLLKNYNYIPRIPFSTLGHRNQVAQFLILIIPLSISFFFLSKHWFKRVLFLGATLLMGYHLFLTKSRGGIIGLLLSFLIILSLFAYKTQAKKGLLGIKKIIFFSSFFLILGLCIAYFFIPTSITIHSEDVQEEGFLIHSLDSSKIGSDDSVSVEFQYQVMKGASSEIGFLDLYGKGIKSNPIYLRGEGKDWITVKEKIQLKGPPFEEDLYFRWVPLKGISSIQLKNIRIEYKGHNLIKSQWFNRIFNRLGITDVDKALSSQARLYMYFNTLKMIQAHPILGIGFGNFKYVYPCYRDRKEWAISGLNTRVEEAHNEYLQILSEVGLLGFLIFMFIILRILKMSWDLLKKEEWSRSFFITLSLTMGILSTLVQSLFDFNFQNPASGITFWSSVGFLEILYQKNRITRKFSFIPLNERPFFRYFFIGGVIFLIIFGIGLSMKALFGDYYLKAGRFCMIVEDWKGALFHLERGRKFSPCHFDIYFHLGESYDQLKNYEKAIESYQKCIHLHPFFIEAKNNLGVLYLKMGKIDEAIEEYKDAIKINPFHPSLHNNLGYLYSKRNLFKEAFSEYFKVLELEPENPETHKNIGLLFYKTGDYKKSCLFLKKYLLLNPNDPQGETLRKIIREKSENPS